MSRLIPLAAFALAAPAFAQTQPSAVRANDRAMATDMARQDARSAVNADAQAQYQADLAAYDAALLRHDARADRQAERYHRQQRAYADAMRDWRTQVYACHHGYPKACSAAAPDPANYY